MGELQNKKTKLSKTRPLWVYPSSLFLFLLCANDPPCPHGSTLPKPRSPERAACPSSTRCQCVSPTRHVVPHLRIPLWSSPLLGSSPWPWQSLGLLFQCLECAGVDWEEEMQETFAKIPDPRLSQGAMARSKQRSERWESRCPFAKVSGARARWPFHLNQASHEGIARVVTVT